ncbi:hypothetical protein [Streptomyces sp. AP-93]|uniref:hypothetical protein n=1 Tax=Streptomyces sp. AP-93 TaxID=2929048 RepID=UPI001FAEB5E0|nr:hypothetical protein [Streptomyces sp. AP-93]MCJ0874317.1 hypothetical protein [Streptomyces sp. AP-93]
MRTRHASPVRTGLGALFLFLAQALALALAAATPAHAHGDTVKVVVTGQREGHVTTEITWENDGDTIDEAVAGTMNATSVDGTRTMGPWRLVRDAGSSTRKSWSTTEVLPAGTWTVHVHVGFPSLGHAESEVAVPVVDPVPPAGSVTPTAVTTTGPSAAGVPSVVAPAPTGPSASPAPAGDRSEGTFPWAMTCIAVAALVGTAAGVPIARRARARRLEPGDRAVEARRAV